MKSAGKVLFMSRTPYMSGTDGSGTMNVQIVEWMRRLGCRVRYVHLSLSDADESTWISPTLQVVTRQAHRTFYDSPGSPEEEAVYRSELDSFRPDMVVLDYGWLGNLCDGATVPEVVLLHDLRSRIIPSFEANGFFHNHHQWDEVAEITAMRMADAIVAINADDAEWVRQRYFDAPLINVKLAADVIECHPDKRVSGRLFYVGSGVQENVLALTDFLEHVWPIVVRRCQSATLHVAGYVGARIDAGRYRNVKVLGRISDLREEYEQATVCIAPAFHFGGMKLKTLGAISHGKAIIGNPAAMEGVDVPSTINPSPVVNDHQSFADVISYALSNYTYRESLERLSMDIRQQRTPEKAYSELFEYMKGIGIVC